MNEQRKVIYQRRQQILDGGSLQDEALAAIEEAIDAVIDANCAGNFSEEWDVEELVLGMQALTDSKFTEDQVRALDSVKSARRAFLDEAMAAYEAKEAAIGSEQLREIERRVMLSVIDQHWREHLYEMDYLREGINLRAMGQRDPLAEWQREGFDMFGAMMESVRDNFVQYVFRLEVVAQDPIPLTPRALTYSAPDDGAQGAAAFEAAAAGFDPGEGPMGPAGEAPIADAPAQQPVRVERVPGRNEPCWCGSGKKYKNCHGG